MLKNLKRLREEAGITQKNLADAVGVSQQSINKYENHKIEPDIETMIQISDYFNTSVDYLVGHTDIRRKIEETHILALNEEEIRLLHSYRALSQKKRRSVDVLIESYNE